MTTDPTLPPKPTNALIAGLSATPGWVKLLLGLSLAVNLAIAGTVVGAILKDGPPHRGVIARDLNFGPFTDALSKEDRDALRRAFSDAAGKVRDQRRDMQADTARLLDTLRAEPFDAAALTTLFEAQHRRAADRFSLGRGLLVDRIVAMTPEARASFADRLEAELTRGKDDKKSATASR